MTRRNFLKNILKLSVALTISSSFIELVKPKTAGGAKSLNVRWVFLVDTYKCVGCGMCVKACKLENEVPYEANVTRTWVERYILTKDERLLIDSPKGGRDGFISSKIEVGMDKYIEVSPEEIGKAFFIPKLCNQCENPPCVQVCPVGATYQTPDGVVLIDRKWCIGCAYCIMACPYGARFFHPIYKVADKCTYCYHRITKGFKPACVQACPFGARKIGNFKDPKDQITKIINTERVGILKEEYGTKPQVYYLGLSKEVR